MTTNPQKITFAEMRASGIRDVLIYETHADWRPGGSRRESACALARGGPVCSVALRWRRAVRPSCDLVADGVSIHGHVRCLCHRLLG